MKKKFQKVTSGKKEAMKKALYSSFGNISEAIRLLEKEDISVSRQSHYRWLEEDEEYAEAVSSAQDRTLDKVEKALQKQIENGSVQATIFYLKTKGKDRGFTEKQEIDLNASIDPIQLIFND